MCREGSGNARLDFKITNWVYSATNEICAVLTNNQEWKYFKAFVKQSKLLKVSMKYFQSNNFWTTISLFTKILE